MIRLEVAVAAPLPGSLTYLLDWNHTQVEDNVLEKSFIGRRVLVPLGGRVITGYVLGIPLEENVAYVEKQVRSVLDDTPLFHANSIPFFWWVARYYHFPIGEVISAALPAGLHKKSIRYLRLCENHRRPDSWPYKDQEEPRWFQEILLKGRLDGPTSKKILENKDQKQILRKLIDDHLLEIDIEISKDKVREKLEFCYRSEIDWHIIADTEGDGNGDLQNFACQLSQYFNRNFKHSEIKTLYYHKKIFHQCHGVVTHSDILKQYKGAAKTLKELDKQGILKKITTRIYRNPFGQIIDNSPPPVDLTDEQKHALKVIKKSIKKKLFETFLLHGVTGSGKTEVYLHAAEECLKTGRDILVLVPEIALATQLESHFISRFGNQVVLLHSALSMGEKYDQWCLAASGKARIVIGARSAVFAPLENIGLIVVDEEHDGGYKQDTGLKYNARDLAVLRGSFANATVILGSATPSITSYYHCRNGKYVLLDLKNRVGGSILPVVKLIDLRKITKNERKNVFHDEFKHQLALNLEKNEQSIILLNRRGFSTSYLCQDCGFSVSCRHCNVALTYHRQKEVLICHYCGFSISSRCVCSNCRSDKLIPFGFGTERIESELAKLYPEAKISRLDSDTATDRKKFIGILKSMHNNEIDILIGTQMIAKGHHFPNVTFVGVVWADGGLNLPDFRAAERTFQLLSQVTGRAGRGEKIGRVMIQTMRPGHYAIELAQTHRYTDFYEKEIGIRKRPLFPPFVRLGCLRISGDIEYNVSKTAENLVNACRGVNRSKGLEIEILGPAASPLDKLQDLYRWQLLLKSNNTRHIHELCSYVLDNVKDFTIGKTLISLDIDPENMM